MSNKRNTMISLIVIFLLLFLFIRSQSFSLALFFKGYHKGSIQYFDQTYDANEDEMKVLTSTSNDKNIIILHMTKSKLGFWQERRSIDVKDPSTGISSYQWVHPAGSRRYPFGLNGQFEWETHSLYCGSNAVKLIEFKPGQLPENVTVNVQQAGELYFIHLISYADLNIINDLDIPNILLDNGNIAVD